MRIPKAMAVMLLSAGCLAVADGSAEAGSAGSGAAVDAGATALVKGNSADAVTSFTEALSDVGLSNDRRASILNDRGVAYMRSGQPKLAIEDFNRAAQLFPEYAAVYNNRGNLLLSLGLLKEAIKDFDRALVLAPGYASAYNNRAGAYIKLGQVADAIQDYTKAVQLMPQQPAPLSGRGRAYLSLDKPYAAIRDFTRAVNADARFASGYRNRAEAKLDVAQFDEAIEDLSRAIAFDPTNAEIHLVRGEAYLGAKNTEAAIKDFSRAIELDPKLVAAYQLRGLAQGYAEAYEEAYADLNLAIELDPRSAIAFAFRAIVYKRNTQTDVGQKDVQTALRLDEGKAEVWWAKAEIDEAMGQTDLAVEAFRKALQLKPSLREATEGLIRLGVTSAAEVAEEQELPHLAIDRWRVVSRAGRPVALSLDNPRLSVPLEAIGEGQPRLLGWELKKAPFLGIGVLRFSGGTIEGRSGKEDMELAAVIDINQGLVIAVEQHRQGSRVANWTWEEGKLTVASTDGVTEEFNLRVGREAVAVAPSTGTRRYSSEPKNFSFWSPFESPWANTGPSGPPKPPARYTTKKKPKTLFDLLFN